MAELVPGVMRDLFARLAGQADAAGAAVLEPLAVAIERQAKINASVGQHRYGTKTPARPGAGPARISGTLVQSITYSHPERTAGGWECKVGTADGLYPPYNHRTPANRYGYYLEVSGAGRSRVKYPFLKPAAETVRDTEAHAIIAEAFRRISWARIP